MNAAKELIMRSAFRTILHSATLALLASCAIEGDADDVDDNEELELAEASQEINTNHVVTQTTWLQRTVALYNCTGVIIGQRHIATAAHCAPRAGHRVGFYRTDGSLEWSGSIVAVYERHGVDDQADDFHDSDGRWADLAVARLASDIPSTHRFADIPTTYAGAGFGVFKVGSGRHNSNDNPSRQLRYAYDTLRSDNDADGAFRTQNHDVNSGDSGGPVFSDSRTVHGVLWGYLWDWGAARYVDRYTSLHGHFNAILAAMGERGRATNRIYNGNSYASYSNTSSSECALTCMQRSRCDAYRYNPSLNTCVLLEDADGTSYVANGYRSGRKSLHACSRSSDGICRTAASQVTQ